MSGIYLSKSAKNMVINALAYCEEEKRLGQAIIPFNNVQDRVCATLGVSSQTVTNIIKEYKEGPLRSPKRKHLKKKTVTKLDEFHQSAIRRFPQDPTRRDKWVKAMRRGAWLPSTSSVVCSMHFSNDSFDRTSLSCVRLRATAIPSVLNHSRQRHIYKKRDVEPGPGAFICSCHFKDGEKKNGPEILLHNTKKRFNVEISPKKKRKRVPRSTRIVSSLTEIPKTETIILPSHSEQATQNATQGNSSHSEQLHIKEEPLEADPSDYSLYQQLRDSIKTEPDNSETVPNNGDPEKHIHSISTDKEHFVNVKKECSDSCENEISVNHETEQIPMFESVFVKTEPFDENDLPS